MKATDIVVPAVLSETRQATCAGKWYVDESEFPPALASYDALINGEETFRAVHLAIAAATKTVDIICWGFQPSMFFIRDGQHPSIGELLRIKAKEGVKVRVLGWEMLLNTAGFAGEANLPGKGPVRLWDQELQNSTPKQYAYDKQWFADCAVPGKKAAEKANARIPLFVSRGFSRDERSAIAKDVKDNSLDRDISTATRHTLRLSATHHQKSVLVDFEVPDRAVGFVMGHNMLDEYWDTDKHSALNRSTHDWPEPNRGPRGFTPRQDISCKVSGEILAYLHHNFATAWEKETDEDLMHLRDAYEVAPRLECQGDLQIAQLLRTQAQEGVRDIEKGYMQAVNNATDFIYIENQYFRWPPLAEKIKQVALTLSKAGKDPGIYGALHLFVVTNATDEGIGSGTVNTQRMLASLGRADTIPEVTKLARIQAIKKQAPPMPRPDLRDQVGQRELKQWQAELDSQIKEVNDSVITMEKVPGLKVHICSLVAPDSPAGKAWMPVYIHSKLMIVNDVFTTHGSANINTRSMQVDSELNIAHEWVSVTEDLRRRLWGMHMGLDETEVPDDSFVAFYQWAQILKNNQQALADGREPVAPLVQLFYKYRKMANLD
ncbi:phospholipase [Pseudomonas sp. dw_358]|uniref:phospholipase n=1 Tax=Pseudomonas sp. dw_358 TaxID=2720083 RepID=UPI001BD32E46|nr:phospholipase [Pseudomonas sp. dw_358]